MHTHTPCLRRPLTKPRPTIHSANHRLEMSSTTPFRELPGRAKVVLPPWELKKDKQEVKYTLKTCRGVPQNWVHDVSACCQYCFCGLCLCDLRLGDLLSLAVGCGERGRGRGVRGILRRAERSDEKAVVYSTTAALCKILISSLQQVADIQHNTPIDDGSYPFATAPMRADLVWVVS